MNERTIAHVPLETGMHVDFQGHQWQVTSIIAGAIGQEGVVGLVSRDRRAACDDCGEDLSVMYAPMVLVEWAVGVMPGGSLKPPGAIEAFDNGDEVALDSYSGGADPLGAWGRISLRFKNSNGLEVNRRYVDVRVDPVRKAMRRLVSAGNAMVVGIGKHNELNADAPARRDDIKGAVPEDLWSATHAARLVMEAEDRINSWHVQSEDMPVAHTPALARKHSEDGRLPDALVEPAAQEAMERAAEAQNTDG